jgi:hypothetical protein
MARYRSINPQQSPFELEKDTNGRWVFACNYAIEVDNATTLCEDIAAFLAASGFGAVATNIFTGDLPASPDAAIAVDEYAGQQPEQVLDGAASIAVEMPRVQIRVRHATKATAKSTARQIFALLAPIVDRTLP